MNDQKSNQFQYQSLQPNPSPEPNDYPITPPPYTPIADQNSYYPNPSNIGFIGTQQPIYGQPLPSQEAHLTSYGTIIQTVPQTVIFLGSCPACHVGILEDDFTCLGILMAILFFPLGILCCLAFKQKRCPNCGLTFE